MVHGYDCEVSRRCVSLLPNLSQCCGAGNDGAGQGRDRRNYDASQRSNASCERVQRKRPQNVSSHASLDFVQPLRAPG